jgi:hypothetical protein
VITFQENNLIIEGDLKFQHVNVYSDDEMRS